jgi:aminoglycoside phosphotransferase family enzyme
VDARAEAASDPPLAAKVAFLSAARAYPSPVPQVTRQETHMSWVFFAGGRVYKLKKPERLPYLDFSTLAARETACRAEYRLNQRLAPDVYEAVLPLVGTPDGLRLGGPGPVVDWVVVMRRLDPAHSLEARLSSGDVADSDLDRLAQTLTRFYRQARRVPTPAARALAGWRAALRANEAVLLDPTLGLPAGLVRHLCGVARRFLRCRRALLASRARRVVDAHGDLRPEHVWIGSPVRIIDRLEFSAALRAVDPLDEIAFLDMECERLGAPDVGERIRRRVVAGLCDAPPPELYLFYRTYRALLRARLSIAHLLDSAPRTPQKWPRQARLYLAIAALDARRLERLLRTPSGP